MEIDNIEIAIPSLYVLAGMIYAIPVAFFDREMIKLEKVGFWYHNVKTWFHIAALMYGSYLLGFTWIQAFWLMLIFHTAYSLVFDILLNVLRGLHWNYIGKTAQFDKLARKLFKNGENYAFVKAFMIFTISLIFTIYYGV